MAASIEGRTESNTTSGLKCRLVQTVAKAAN